MTLCDLFYTTTPEISVIDTGLTYQNKALSGFIRESALEEKRREANEQLEAEQSPK